jgi:hypothetical protein
MGAGKYKETFYPRKGRNRPPSPQIHYPVKDSLDLRQALTFRFDKKRIKLFRYTRMFEQETNIFFGHLNFIYKTLKALRSCSAANGQKRAVMCQNSSKENFLQNSKYARGPILPTI